MGLGCCMGATGPCTGCQAYCAVSTLWTSALSNAEIALGIVAPEGAMHADPTVSGKGRSALQ